MELGPARRRWAISDRYNAGNAARLFWIIWNRRWPHFHPRTRDRRDAWIGRHAYHIAEAYRHD